MKEVCEMSNAAHAGGRTVGDKWAINSIARTNFFRILKLFVADTTDRPAFRISFLGYSETS